MTQVKITIVLLALLMTGCSEERSGTETASMQERWYTDDMVRNGKPLYEKHCASCHGLNGEGVVLPWNKPLADGKYPPPPLNDDAHAWHHPLNILRLTVNEGGKPVGGQMPSFKEKLNEKQVDEVIAYFQDFWSEPFYEEWLKRGGLER
jgi:mono/diheme cytochrome c family protein